jgi:8-oxo-dGTP pyrophosphatase MutT (NUDIX family)
MEEKSSLSTNHVRFLYAMKQLSGALLYNTNGEVLLQHRDDKPDIADPGLWSLFGGSVEEGESIEDALIRELWEELEYPVKEKQLWLIACQPGATFHIFLLPLDLPLEKLVLHEGQGFGLYKPQQALEILPLSPVARYVLRTFIAEQLYQQEVMAGIICHNQIFKRERRPRRSF